MIKFTSCIIEYMAQIFRNAFYVPFLHPDQLFVSTKAQPAFDWTQIQHMFWTILLVQFGEHDQLASKRFPRMIKSG